MRYESPEEEQKFSGKASISYVKRNQVFLVTIWKEEGVQELFSVSRKYTAQFLARLFTSPSLVCSCMK